MRNLSALAELYGTPFYVYDLDEVDAASRELFTMLPAGCEVFYALKANPHPGVVNTLRKPAIGGCHAEISSTGELGAALAAGLSGGDCLYTGPGKTSEELGAAIAAGVRLFSTDSVTDVRRVGAAAVQHGTTVDCLLRINSATASASTSIRMTGTPSQFGFDSETLAAVVPELRAVAGVRLAGMHFFPLSNAADEDSLVDEFQHTIALAAQLSEELELPLEFLDIGGGFAAPYGVPGERGVYPGLRAALEVMLDKYLPGWRDRRPVVACESGRFLVSCAGTLVTRVVNVKESRGRRFVITDAGINSFGGMSGLGRLLPVSVRVDGDEPVSRGSLVGPLCTPGDVLGREIALPELAAGDLVTIPNAGAYGPTASLLGFLGRPAPVEVVVRGEEIVSASRLELRRHAVGRVP